jgi:hypothetical protein
VTTGTGNTGRSAVRFSLVRDQEFAVSSPRRFRSLPCFIVRYSEFRNIPSCRLIPLPGADEIKRVELLNSEYSCQSSCLQKQKWIAVRLKPRAARGTRICVAAGPAIKNGRRNELQKRISRREARPQRVSHKPSFLIHLASSAKVSDFEV